MKLSTILLSVISLLISIAIIDSFFPQGAIKYILIGLVVAIILSYNKKMYENRV
jgi:hypothetical protein